MREPSDIFAHMQQLIDRCRKFLMVGATNSLDLGFSVVRELHQILQELMTAAVSAGALDGGDEFVKIVIVILGEDYLSTLEPTVAPARMLELLTCWSVESRSFRVSGCSIMEASKMTRC